VTNKAGLAPILVLVLLITCHACGRAGNAQESPALPPSADASPAPPGPELAPVTNIGFDLIQTVAPTPVGCAKPGAVAALAEIAPEFSLGGTIDRWPEEALLWNDPSGDSSPDLDIRRVYGGIRSGDFIAAIQTPGFRSDHQIVMEFGGVRVRGGDLDAQVLREFRIYGAQLEERDGDRWKPVSPEFGQVIIPTISATSTISPILAIPADAAYLDEDNAVVEVRLGIRMVADIMNWPIWWLRFSTRSGDGTGDSTSGRHFPSRLSGDEDRYSFSSCGSWGNDETPFGLMEITDRHDHQLESLPREAQTGAAGYEYEYGKRDGSGPTSPAMWDFNSFGLVRSAYDSVSTLLGRRSLGVDQLTVVGSLVTGDRSGGALPAANDSARFGYIFTESRRLADGATGPRPFEEIYADAGAQMLHIYATSSGFAAPKWLREAYASAMFLHLAETNLGRLFVLNRFKDAAPSFLGGLGEDSPLRLPHSQPLTPQQVAKARAFSYLLYAYFDAKTLVNAWANALSRFSEVENPDEAFRSSLLDLANTVYPHRKNELLLERIWSGWVYEGAYADFFAPRDFDDSDKDGLPDFLETASGYSSTNADTDLDGFTDLMAFVRAGGASEAPHPGEQIIDDGSFSDWTRLLPQRINLHRGQSGSCPEPAAISHFAALASTSGMLIGAYSDHFPETGNVHWEALIDLPEIKRQLLLTTNEDGSGVVVSDAVTRNIHKIYKYPRHQGASSIEWAFRFEDMKLDPAQIQITRKNAVAIRLRTVHRAEGKEIYCDETSWFETNVVQ